MATWNGSPPSHCDICNRHITDAFIDGRTAFGPWAMMCPMCHADNGGELGVGKGQKYHYEGRVWTKVTTEGA